MVSNQSKSYIFRGCLAVMAMLVAGPVLSTSGQAQVTEKHSRELFEKRCGGCHALDRDKEGPRLGGVYGRAAASITSFQYSTALQKSKITWTGQMLDKWLTDPEKVAPDNDMAFHVESSDERLELISYLKQHSGK
jgi:cytochrome c